MNRKTFTLLQLGAVFLAATSAHGFLSVDTNGVVQSTNFWPNNLSNRAPGIIKTMETNTATATRTGTLSSNDWSTFNAKAPTTPVDATTHGLLQSNDFKSFSARQGGSGNLTNWSGVSTGDVPRTVESRPVSFSSSGNQFNAAAVNALNATNANFYVGSNLVFEVSTNIVVFKGFGNTTNNVPHYWDSVIGVYSNAQHRSVWKFQNPTWYLTTPDGVNQYSSSAAAGAAANVVNGTSPAGNVVFGYNFYVDGRILGALASDFFEQRLRDNTNVVFINGKPEHMLSVSNAANLSGAGATGFVARASVDPLTSDGFLKETNSMTVGGIFVDAISGDDTTGLGTASRPYATLTKAQEVAVSGNTIVGVRGTFVNGYYGKPGVSWYFNEGVALTNTTWVVGPSQTMLTNADTTLNIYGRATLYGSGAGLAWLCLNVSNATVNAHFKEMATNGTVPKIWVMANGGNSNIVNIKADTIIDSTTWSANAYVTTSLTNVIAINYDAKDLIWLHSHSAMASDSGTGVSNRMFTMMAPIYRMYPGLAAGGTPYAGTIFRTTHFRGGNLERNGITTPLTASRIISSGLRFMTTNDLPTTASSITNIYGFYGIGGFDGLGAQGVGSYARNKLALQTITPSGSPFSWTNTTLGNLIVFVTSGTVSDIALNGTSVSAATGLNVPLQPGEWTTVTYSVAPTMTYKPF